MKKGQKRRPPEEIKPTPDTRKCIRCGEVKHIDEYQFHRGAVDGRKSTCRACVTIQARERIHAMSEEEYAQYRNRVNTWARTSETHKEWKENNRDKLRANFKRHVENWTDEDKKRRREYERNYYSSSDQRLHRRISQGLRVSLQDRKAGKKWESILEYNTEELALHIEALFEPGMSWDNMGEWHIDHYIPKSWFGDDEESAKAAWSIFNLQPKWAEENIRKSNLYVG